MVIHERPLSLLGWIQPCVSCNYHSTKVSQPLHIHILPHFRLQNQYLCICDMYTLDIGLKSTQLYPPNHNNIYAYILTIMDPQAYMASPIKCIIANVPYLFKICFQLFTHIN